MPEAPRTLTERIYTARGFSKASLAPLKVLHLGCGTTKITDATGIDSLALAGVDVVHNLEVTPWPFAANTFDVIVAHAVLEHLQPFIPVMNEIHRVGKHGARAVVCVPYFRSRDAFNDPTHAHFFTSSTMDFVLGGESGLAEYRYTDKLFRRVGFWYGWPQQSKSYLTRLFKRFIYTHQRFYDQYLSLLFPMRILLWEIEVVKGSEF